jgi:glycine/D-amino acid oxidase-like deaminating enzyme
MKYDFLVVGQGIAGTLISHELLSRGKKIMVFDQVNNHAASRVAGAVLNPAVLKGRSKELNFAAVDAAVEVYSRISGLIGEVIISKKDMLVFPGNQDEDQSYRMRVGEKYISGVERDPDQFRLFFNSSFEPVSVSPVWQVNAPGLLDKWKGYLSSVGVCRNEKFMADECEFEKHGVKYKDINAGKIIFCEGVDAGKNPMFATYPFVANRGDVLLLDIPGLPQEKIYHRKFRLIPMGQSLFWFGSNYNWTFTDMLPDANWRSQAEEELRNWLKLEYTVVSHTTAERPTTAGQIPLCRVHDSNPTVIIFNGLGTKGFTNGPMLARQLAEMIC